MRCRVRGWEEVRWRARGRELWRVRERGERELGTEVDELVGRCKVQRARRAEQERTEEGARGEVSDQLVLT